MVKKTKYGDLFLQLSLFFVSKVARNDQIARKKLFIENNQREKDVLL